MISTTDPAAMTAEQRQSEAASLLARGLLRYLRASPKGTLGGKTVRKTSETGLELSSETRLSVAQRPAS